MDEKPKPLTKAEWEQMKAGYTLQADDIATLDDRIDATLDALFRYRERTRGGVGWKQDNPIGSRMVNTDDIAAEEGIE